MRSAVPGRRGSRLSASRFLKSSLCIGPRRWRVLAKNAARTLRNRDDCECACSHCSLGSLPAVVLRSRQRPSTAPSRDQCERPSGIGIIVTEAIAQRQDRLTQISERLGTAAQPIARLGPQHHRQPDVAAALRTARKLRGSLNRVRGVLLGMVIRTRFLGGSGCPWV